MLAELHRRTAGRAASTAQLIELVWPRERFSSAASARNRLRVCIAKLRRAGFATALQKTRDGYRLDSAVTVRAVD